MKHMLVGVNDFIKASIVEDMIILLPFGDTLAKEVPCVTIMQAFGECPSILIDLDASWQVKHDECCNDSMIISCAVVGLLGTKIKRGCKVCKAEKVVCLECVDVDASLSGNPFALTEV